MNLRDLERAWALRQKQGIAAVSEAYRVFHGPGEASTPELKRYAIDRFGAFAWVTEWEQGGSGAELSIFEEMSRFLEAQGLQGAVVLERPKAGIPQKPRVLFGQVPSEPFSVREHDARFLIRLTDTRHPGLFLDHEPLRRWLTAHSEGWKVLNCFAYTGSLSVAAGIGGADHVTTLDLSKPTVSWARDNWAHNGLEAGAADFIADDVFERLPRIARQEVRYDCVILDPPSFSRGKKSNFSTQKDLYKLHVQALMVLKPEGVIATSINSANVTREKYRAEVLRAATDCGVSLSVIEEIQLPPSFPSRDHKTDYLKGWIFKARAGRPAAAPRKRAARG